MKPLIKTFYFIIFFGILTIFHKFFVSNRIEIDFNNSFLKNNLVCMILTSETTIKSRGLATWNTWAKYCNISFFSCNCKKYKQTLSKHKDLWLTDVNRLSIMQLTCEENYWKMGYKVIEVLIRTFESFFNEDRWFLMADDDTFIYFDNLLRFLDKLDLKKPYVYGARFKDTVQNGYIDGGGGILFTSESFKRIYESIQSNKCSTIHSYGDKTIGFCMGSANVTFGESRDDKNRERFHTRTLKQHILGPLDEWTMNNSFFSPQVGGKCCSEDSISFHKLTANEMLFYAKMTFKDAFDYLMTEIN